MSKKSQSQNIAYQWNQEEEQTNQDRQYTNNKAKKIQISKLPSPERWSQ